MCLDLACNSLTGQIPEALEKLELLREINLEDNVFCGGIPNGLWRVSNHDLEEVAMSLGNEITGHLREFSIVQQQMTIETCPEWPPKLITMRVRNPQAMRGLQVGELVGVIRTEMNLEGWAESVWRLSERETLDAPGEG